MVRLIKKFISLFLPTSFKEKIRFKLRILRNYRYDFQRFLRWSTTESKFVSQIQKKALIIKEYHRVEKALALPNPRVPFGLVLVKDLMVLLEEYVSEYPVDDIVVTSVSVLSEYFKFHHDRGFNDMDLNGRFEQLKAKMVFNVQDCSQGGSIDLTKEAILSKGQVDLRAFFEARFSIRHFSDKDVDAKTIEQAILMARKTPSVCNRQSSKVHLYSNKNDILELLQFQNGNAGFREQVNKLLIVTSDLQNFLNIGERYQCWIDGGMFAMSVIYALHSLGLGTCCLNWSVEFGADKDIRSRAGIPDSETIIMLIAVGHLPDKFKVARSIRKQLKEYMIQHS